MHDGRGDGVLVRDHGQGIVEENRIFMNAAVGVKVLSPAPEERGMKAYSVSDTSLAYGWP